MFEIKTKRTSKERKNSKNFFKFDSGCTVFSKNTSRSVKDQLTKLGWLISGFITKGEKLKFKTPCLTWWQVLSKNQRAPSNREKLQQCFKFHSGCNFWQSTPQNLLNINLQSFSSCLQEPSEKEQKEILSYLSKSKEKS